MHWILLTVLTQDINPYPRERIRAETLLTWNFENTEGWTAAHECDLTVRDGILRIRSTGGDPYVHGPAIRAEGPVVLKLRMKAQAGGDGQIFWITRQSAGWDEEKSAHFAMTHDGEWHDYSVPLEVKGTLAQLRLDPGSAPGDVEIDRTELERVVLHPIEILRVGFEAKDLQLSLQNHSEAPIQVAVGSRTFTIEGGKTADGISLKPVRRHPFEAFEIEAEPEKLPKLRRTVFLHHADLVTDWIERESGDLKLRVAKDGSGARIERGGKLLTILAPIVAAKLDWVGDLEFKGDGIRVELRLEKDLIVEIDSDRIIEGPVLRAIGSLEQGLFAGVEYLGKRESSSSTLDIETPDRIRFLPNPLHVTLPLMAVVTDRGSAAMTWEETGARPVFACPNFFDGTPDHRMALRGSKIRARIRIGGTLEEAILWATKLPPLPDPPRSREAQRKLCLDSLNGPLRDEKGWGHCAEPNWGRAPHADMASTVWRLTGEVPKLDSVAPGGSHVRNDAIYFVTGRAQEWLDRIRAEARSILSDQKKDGSWRYDGPYRRGHFEDSASGWCAPKAAALLEAARLTGDKDALDGGIRALEFMKRFRTPRGAQTWELSLHTPDILASAYLAWAYVRGHELTGKKEYLDLARKWALTGVPFVYLRGPQPYATIAVYGATNWRAPLWIGLPVQWCGTVYAYAILLLAPHDATLEWKNLAEGILVAAERMQYPDGKLLGCLPDVFSLGGQRMGPSINPCALVSLRLALDGDVDSIAVARGIVAPFPISVEEGKAVVRGRGKYQIVVDGKRVIDAEDTATID